MITKEQYQSWLEDEVGCLNPEEETNFFWSDLEELDCLDNGNLTEIGLLKYADELGIKPKDVIKWIWRKIKEFIERD